MRTNACLLAYPRRPLGPWRHTATLAVLAALSTVGCTTEIEKQSSADLARVQDRMVSERSRDVAPLKPEEEEADLTPLGTLESYVARAFSSSPDLRASFEEWRAALAKPAQARKLPEPTITYGGFIRAVETRVGPQQHRLGLMQWFPWPTRLTASGEAAAYAAVSAQQRFEALALDISAQVARAYWRVWFIHKNQEVQREQRAVLQSFADQVRARLESGLTGLSDLAQVDLAISRISDVIAGLREAEIAASAELVRIVGAEDGTPTPIRPQPDPPQALMPASRPEQLKEHALVHPRILSMAFLSNSADELARAARGQKAPSIGIGLDWIVTGEALDPNAPDSGQDAVIGMVALQVPIWVRAYKEAEREAEAQAAMFRAKERAARDRVLAELNQALADLRDAIRRVRLYRTTLVPQAETTYTSTLHGYESGRASLAEVLMAERDLLELELGLYKAHADYGTLWAELERIVGQPLPVSSDEAAP